MMKLDETNDDDSDTADWSVVTEDGTWTTRKRMPRD